MKNEFVSYEQALALKKLGFDEDCFGGYDCFSDLFIGYNSEDGIEYNPSYYNKAALKQQVFRWFRKKYGYIPHIYIYDDVNKYDYDIYGGLSDKYDEYDLGNDFYDTYEEAENACIDKLIELAKQENL